MLRPNLKATRIATASSICVLLALTIVFWAYKRQAGLHVQQRYLLSAQSLKEWTPYGGTWEIINGSVHNNSDERGAKLVTGSEFWTDYTLQADLHFDGNHGDMGLIIRSNDEEEGVDAYRGYYVGLRTTDGTLVIGRADFGWMEAKPITMPGGVNDNNWYRLTVTAFNCSIAAKSENLTTRQTAWMVLEENPCLQSGRIGLRSLATGGRWRNISVTPAALQDYLRIRSHVASTSPPEFPKREADYNSLLSQTQPETSGLPPAVSPPALNAEDIHIGDLLDLPQDSQQEVVIRGVVTLTSPDLYVQDSTGGVLVKHSAAQTLNVGDVVEVRGHVQPGLYSASIETNSIRLLWIGTPVPPLSVTPAQAASGAYDARFIQIEGRLTHRETARDGSQFLSITDGVQSFMTVNTHRHDETPQKIAVNSYLRVRGICALGRAYTHELTPFVVLLPSSEDIQILAEPPWWTPWHECMLFVGLLMIALLLQVAYFRFQRWKTDTITRERERFAHEIHDTMAQGFAGVGYQIQGIRKTVATLDQIDRRQVSEQLGMAYQLVRRCHEEASRTIAMLSQPSPPLHENLLTTLAEAARRISGEQIRTITRVEGTPLSLRLRTANAFLHIGREAVVNAAAHAGPSEIVITLHYGDDYVELIVADNGGGFEFRQENAGFGILGMQKRAHDISGILEILSTSGIGTEVRIHANLHNEAIFSRAMMALKKHFSMHNVSR